MRRVQTSPAWLLTIALCCVLHATAAAEQLPVSLRITEPQMGASAGPAEEITVRVEPDAGAAVDDVYVMADDVDHTTVDLTPPFEMSLELPRTLGPVVLRAFGNYHGGLPRVTSEPITIQLTTAKTLETLSVAGGPLTLRVGESWRLYVFGHFAGGPRLVALGGKLAGTTYSTVSGTSDVATVSEDGVVTPVAPGKDSIQVSNRGISTLLEVIVTQQPTPAPSATAPATTPSPTPQPLLLSGKVLTLSDNVKPEKRGFVVWSQDERISLGQGNGSEHDPRTTGASLRVRTTAGCEPNPSPCDNAYQLPASGWTLIGKPGQNKGYKYKDAKLLNGPTRRRKRRR